MAVSTNLVTLNDCDAVSGFTELAAPHSSGAAPALDEENYIQNNTLPASISQASGQALDQAAGFQYTHGTTFTLANANDVMLMWTYYAAPTNLKSWSIGGGRIGIGTEDNLSLYNAMGNNFGNYPYGGWQNTAIDPDLTSDQDVGTPSGTTFDSVCFLPNVTAKITKGTPIGMDVIRYGRGDIVVTGTETFTSMATANDAVAARWGLFQGKGGGIFTWKGLMSLGAATSISHTDSDKTILIEDSARVADGFNKLEITHASSVVDWTSITFTGIQTSITGSAPVSRGDFEVISSLSVDMITCKFSDMGTFVFDANSTLDGCTHSRCETLTQTGATISDGVIADSFSAIAMTVNNVALVTGNTFEGDGTITPGHAVDLGTLGSVGGDTISWDNVLVNSGNQTEWVGAVQAPSTINTGDANSAILVNIATGNSLKISVADTGSIPTVYVTGGGSLEITASEVTLLVKVVDNDTGLALANARVNIVDDATKTEILNAECDVNGEATSSLAYTADIDVVGWVREMSLTGTDYTPKDVSGTITISGLTISVRLQPI